MPKLSATLSGTPLERELDTLERALSRTSWDVDLRFDASCYEPRVVARVASQWRARMVFEHRSSTVFSQLASQLYEANATLDAKIVMLRMAQDELRHTATCAEVVRALGGDAEPEAELTVEPLAMHRGVAPEERALRNVIYTTSCSEMIACARFVATLDHTEDPYLRQVMRRLLADEILHGQFGFHYLEAWRPWLEARPEIIASLERYLTHAFAVIERELAPEPPFEPLDAQSRALGADDASLAREVFYGTMEGAIVPGLERFGIDATRCWTERARAV
ncbi:MAG: ferritin-like domain-containing protein [Myxococcota bacterium]|nr:ferritin-like domain-containing protein [Myxococcota bacterium]